MLILKYYFLKIKNILFNIFSSKKHFKKQLLPQSYIILSESIIIIAHIYKANGIIKAYDISLCLVL
jgi:hypothetical protein